MNSPPGTWTNSGIGHGYLMGSDGLLATGGVGLVSGTDGTGLDTGGVGSASCGAGLDIGGTGSDTGGVGLVTGTGEVGLTASSSGQTPKLDILPSGQIRSSDGLFCPCAETGCAVQSNKLARTQIV